jgi:hypothetical protein
VRRYSRHNEGSEDCISDHAPQHPPGQLGGSVDRLKDHLRRGTDDGFKLVNLMHRAQFAEQRRALLRGALRE